MTALDKGEPAKSWVEVASVAEFPQSGLLEVHVGRHIVLLVKSDDEIRAFQGLCPHQLARLSEGMVIDDAIQCPRHLARFNLADGSCTGGWYLAPLRQYDVRIEDDRVLLPDPLVARM